MNTFEAITIRLFEKNDYSPLVKVHNLLEPDYPHTVEEVRHWDKSRSKKIDFRRMVATKTDELIGMAEFGQMSDMYHPQKFFFYIEVHPEFQKRGYGSLLFKQVLNKLEPFQAKLLRTRSREDRLSSLDFLTHRGFAEENRDWESRLNPQVVKLERFENVFKRMDEKGIRLITLGELMDTDPDYLQNFYKLDIATTQDEPRPEGEVFTPRDFDTWQQVFLSDPNLIPEASLFAVVQGEYVGFSQLWKSQAEARHLFNGMTGVRREWRRKGIALALKVQNLKWAKAQGYQLIKTWNNTTNRGMLSINEALGFEKQPAWINFKKELSVAL